MRLGTRTWARLDYLDAGTLAFSFPYNPDMVTSLKQSLRGNARWDGTRKAWLVDSAYAQMCADLALLHLGVQVALPKVPAQTTTGVETRVVLLEYIGRTKQGADGEAWATGYADGAWSLRFPEAVLRAWFEVIPEDAPPGQATTLYGILGIGQTSTGDEVRAAYRRLARSLHPDVNKEEDATEQFIAIQEAYEALSDPIKRRRYDAGLRLECDAVGQSMPSGRLHNHGPIGYRTPLRCGYVAVEGTPRLGQFAVSKINAWEDVIRDDGKVMVTTWPNGAKEFLTCWV